MTEAKSKYNFDVSNYVCQNKGTFFYRRKKSRETISRALKNTVEGAGIRATARVFDLNKDTKARWSILPRLGEKNLNRFQ